MQTTLGINVNGAAAIHFSSRVQSSLKGTEAVIILARDTAEQEWCSRRLIVVFVKVVGVPVIFI